MCDVEIYKNKGSCEDCINEMEPSKIGRDIEFTSCSCKCGRMIAKIQCPKCPTSIYLNLIYNRGSTLFCCEKCDDYYGIVYESYTPTGLFGTVIRQVLSKVSISLSGVSGGKSFSLDIIESIVKNKIGKEYEAKIANLEKKCADYDKALTVICIKLANLEKST